MTSAVINFSRKMIIIAAVAASVCSAAFASEATTPANSPAAKATTPAQTYNNEATTPAQIAADETTVSANASDDDETTTAAAASTDDTPRSYDKGDPLEDINRAIFRFNRGFDNVALKPAAHIYNDITPAPVRTGVTNFFSNMGEVPIMINDTLQFNLVMGYTSLWRFMINTTVGVLGIFDIASHMGLQKHYNDFGITLAKWGVTESPYIQIPFIGPSNIRDGLAMIPNFLFFSLWPHIEPSELANGLFVLDVVNLRASLLDSEDIMEKAALDQYVFLRNAYMQKRQNMINTKIHYLDPDVAEDQDPLAEEGGDPLAGYPEAAEQLKEDAELVDDPEKAAQDNTDTDANAADEATKTGVEDITPKDNPQANKDRAPKADAMNKLPAKAAPNA